MAIQRWDPEQDLARLQQNVNRAFDEVLSRSATPGGTDRAQPGDWKPPLDLFETDDHFVLRADLPGVSPSAVDLRIEAGQLLLIGERRRDPESYLRMERPNGRFSARIALPPSIDREQIRASHRNGVLEVVLPKSRGDTASRVEIADS